MSSWWWWPWNWDRKVVEEGGVFDPDAAITSELGMGIPLAGGLRRVECSSMTLGWAAVGYVEYSQGATSDPEKEKLELARLLGGCTLNARKVLSDASLFAHVFKNRTLDLTRWAPDQQAVWTRVIEARCLWDGRFASALRRCKGFQFCSQKRHLGAYCDALTKKANE